MSKNYIQDIPPIDLVGLPETQVVQDAQHQTESTLNFDEKMNNAQKIAAGASVLGNGLMMIPTPWTIGAGLLLQFPDLAFDIYAAKEAARKGENMGSTLSSLAFDAAGALPGAGAAVVSSADDLSTVLTGNNIYDNIVKAASSPKKSEDYSKGVDFLTKEYYDHMIRQYRQRKRQPFFSGRGPLAPNSTTYGTSYPSFLRNILPWQQPYASKENLPQGVVGVVPHPYYQDYTIPLSPVEVTTKSLKTTLKGMDKETKVGKLKTKYAKGGPLKKSYKDFSTRLSKAWDNQDISKDDYDYQKYYNDNPTEAYRQLRSIEKGSKGHFPDGGKSGTYKKLNHPTYPDLGINSWLNNDRIFNMSARQAVPTNTDRVLDYLGSDLYYNNGSTKAMYNGAYQLPTVNVTPNGNYTELIPNELNTGWMYRNRANRYQDLNYNYISSYLNGFNNQKALGGNLFAKGSWMPNKQWQNRIAKWEGSSMYKPAPDTGRVNSSFQAEANRFLSVLPKKALQKLPDQAINALYSYSYNVGAGNFKKRVVPVLNKYLNGQASLQQLTNSMYATKDSQLRGLQTRRKYERGALEAAITGNDIMGTAAYNNYEPLLNRNSFNRNNRGEYTTTAPIIIGNNENSPTELNPYNKQMQQYAKMQYDFEAANERIDKAVNDMIPNIDSDDSYLNSIYNDALQNERDLFANDVKNYVKEQSTLEQINNSLSNIGYEPYPNSNIYEKGGTLMKPSTNSKLTFRRGIYTTDRSTTYVQPKISQAQLNVDIAKKRKELAEKKKEKAAVNRELAQRRSQYQQRLQAYINYNSKDPTKRIYNRAVVASSNTGRTQPKATTNTTKNTSLNTKKYVVGKNYRTRRGDTLSKIALTSGIPISNIIKANPQISNINNINEGEFIYLPKVNNLFPLSKEEILEGIDQRTPFEKTRNQYLIRKKEQIEAEKQHELKLLKLSPYEQKIQLLADEAENAANEAAINDYTMPIRTKTRVTDINRANPRTFDHIRNGLLGGIRASLYGTSYKWVDPVLDVTDNAIEGLNNFLIRHNIIEENGIPDLLLGSTHNVLTDSSPSQNVVSYVGDKVKNYDPTNYIGNGLVSSLQSTAFTPGPWQAKLAGAVAGFGSSMGGQYEAQQGNELASLLLYSAPISVTNSISKVMSSPGFAAANRTRKIADATTRGLATAIKDTTLGTVGEVVADELGMLPEEKMGVMAVTQMAGDKVKIKGKTAQQYIESYSPVKDRINDLYLASQGNPSPRWLAEKYTQYRQDKKAGITPLNEYTGTTIDSEAPVHRGKNGEGYGTYEGTIYTDYNGNQVKVVTGRDIDTQQKVLSRTSQNVTFDTTIPIWSYVSGKLALRSGQTAHYADASITMRRLEPHDVGYDPKNPSKNVVYEISPTKLKATDIGAKIMDKEYDVQNSRDLRKQLLEQGYTEVATNNESWYNSDRARNKGTTTVIQKNGGIVQQAPVNNNLKGAIRQVTTYKNSIDRNKDVIVIGGNDLAQPGSQRIHYATTNDSATNAKVTSQLGIGDVSKATDNYYSKYVSKYTPLKTTKGVVYSVEDANTLLSEVVNDLSKSVKIKDTSSLRNLLLSHIKKLDRFVPTKGVNLSSKPFDSKHKSYKSSEQSGSVIYGVPSGDLKNAIKEIIASAKTQVEQSGTIGISANQLLNAKARQIANSISYRVRTDLGSIKYTREELKANLSKLKEEYKNIKKGKLIIQEEKLTPSEIKKLKDAGYMLNTATNTYSLPKEEAAALGVGGEFMQTYLDDTQILQDLIKFAEE